MRSRFELLFAYLLLSAISLSAVEAFAVEVKTGTEDIKLKLDVLLQARAIGSWDGDLPTATGGPSPAKTFDTDLMIRRARLITSGVAFKHFTYYIMLDTPNFGIRGNYTGSTYLQDLHIGYTPIKNVDFEVGFLYMPLSHLSLNSSSSTSAIEKSTAILFYNNARGLRENGAQVRALFFDNRLYLRGGVYEGLHETRIGTAGCPTASTCPTPVINPHGRPEVAGHLRLNIIGEETGYAFPSIYLDGKTRVSVGVGAQWQGAASNVPVTTINAAGLPVTNPTGRHDYLALAADLFADLALPGNQEVTFQGDVYRFDWGPGSDKTGYGTTIEAAYRWGQISPQVNGYWFNSDSRQNSFLKVAGGVNYFIKGHQAKVGLEFWHILSATNLNNPALHQLVLQAQANF